MTHVPHAIHRRLLLVIVALAVALAGVATPLPAQAAPAARGDTRPATAGGREVIARMRVDLAAHRYGEVIERGNALLESASGPAPSERLQLWTLLAAAYFPPEAALQRPDSAALPLAAMIHLIPDVTLDPAISWAGLDALLEIARAQQFAVVTRPLAEYAILPDAPAFLTVVASRPARFRLTSIAVATGVAVVHAQVEGTRAVALPLFAQVGGREAFGPGDYRLEVRVIDRATGDSVLLTHRVTASVTAATVASATGQSGLLAPAASIAPSAAPSVAPSAVVAARDARSRPRPTALVVGGLAFAGATVAIAALAQPDGSLRDGFRIDPRGFVVAASMLGATLLAMRSTRPSARPGVRPIAVRTTAVSPAPVPSPAAIAPARTVRRVILRLDRGEP